MTTKTIFLSTVNDTKTGAVVLTIYAATHKTAVLAYDHAGKKYFIPAGAWTCVAEEAEVANPYLVLFDNERRPALFESAQEVEAALNEAHNNQFPNNQART